MTFCFRKTSFVHSRSGTYYALLLGYFGMKFLPDIRHNVYWVLADIWAPIFSHKIGNKFLFIIVRVERKVRLTWNCLIFFLFENSSVLPKICRVLSQIQWRFLGEISRKNNFGRIFQKFCANQGYPLAKLVKFRPNFCNFIRVRTALKKFTQVPSYVVCTKVRRHVYKLITKRRYGKEKL